MSLHLHLEVMGNVTAESSGLERSAVTVEGVEALSSTMEGTTKRLFYVFGHPEDLCRELSKRIPFYISIVLGHNPVHQLSH